MEFLNEIDFKKLRNPGVVSAQLISPHNSKSTNVTITRVTVEAGAIQACHKHDTSEQIWIALSGNGTLLLAGDQTQAFASGEVVRFEAGDIHGFRNTGSEPFTYLAVTAPPINFQSAYQNEG